MKQIAFYRKSRADFEFTQVTVSATQSPDIIANVLDRSNKTAWGTTGSVDADNTQIVITFGDVETLDSFFLLQHNFKAFLLEYQDGVGTWHTLANVTAQTSANYYLNIGASVGAAQVRLTIYGTQVANSDKTLSQFITTSSIGQLNGWPIIGKPTLALNLIKQAMLSGKVNILQNVGFYSASLTVANWSNPTDLAIVETLYGASEGFLYWPCGGDELQFSSIRQGYRMQDIYLCRFQNEFTPEFVSGLYKTGQKLQLDVIEVVT